MSEFYFFICISIICLVIGIFAWRAKKEYFSQESSVIGFGLGDILVNFFLLNIKIKYYGVLFFILATLSLVKAVSIVSF